MSSIDAHKDPLTKALDVHSGCADYTLRRIRMGSATAEGEADGKMLLLHHGF